MRVSAGAICEIILSEKESIKGVLAEAVTINLSSSFKPVVSDSDNGAVQTAIDMTGTVLRSITGANAGFSSKFKQWTTQVWGGTEPAGFNINLCFPRVPINAVDTDIVSAKNVIDVVKRFCAIPLPAEGPLGNLTPPGPSVIEGITGNDLQSGKGVDASGLVTVKIGNMTFQRLIMLNAEPTFSQYCDDSGYPIDCRIAFNFKTMWAATKQLVTKEWWGENE